MWWLFTPIAAGAPSAVCPGTCADAPTPCGHPDDCGGGTCVFEDACLPEGAALVAAVVPGSEEILNDFAQYAPGAAVDGELHVGSSLVGINVPAQSALGVPVAPNTRYVLRAESRVDAGVHAYPEVEVVNGDGTDLVVNGPIRLEGDWDVVDVPFTTGPDASLLFARFYGVDPDESGAVARWRNVTLLELRPSSVYVRARLGSPAQTLSMVPAPLATQYGGAVIGTLPTIDVEPGVWSAWVDLAEAYPSMDLTVGFLFRDPEALDEPLPVEVEIEVAWALDPTAVVDTLAFSDATGVAGLHVPGVPPDPLRIGAQVQPLSEVLVRDFEVLAADPAWAPIAAPTAFASTTGIGWASWFGSWETTWPMLDGLADVGLNGLWQDDFPPTTMDHLAEDGFVYRTSSIGPPVSYYLPNAPYPLDDFEAEMGDYYETALSTGVAMEAFAGQRDHLLLDMADELHGARFTGPGYDEGFRDWLKAGCADPEACAPPFGLADWSEVHAATAIDGNGMTVGAVDCLRPRDTEHDPVPERCVAEGYPLVPLTEDTAGLFLAQMQWWAASTAELYARTRAFLEAQGAPGDVPLTSPQLGTPLGYMTYRTGTELQQMYGGGAGSAFFGEGFLSQLDFCDAQSLTVVADWLDGNLDPWGIETRALHLHPNRGHGANRAATLAAHGVDWINWYTYGPHQLHPDGVGGTGEIAADMLREIQDANRVLGTAEGVLAGADVVGDGIAIMAAQNDPLWWDVEDFPESTRTDALSGDELGTHRALTHGHHTVRFLVEDRLPLDLGPDTSALFVHRKFVSDDAFDDGIAPWVEAGGTLVTSGELPTSNALGLDAGRAAWFGITGALDDMEPLVTFDVDWPGVGTFTATTPRRSLAAVTDGTVLATYVDTGEPAVVERTVGAGKVRMIGFELGAAYRASPNHCVRDQLPMRLGQYRTDYVDAIRDAVNDAVADVPRVYDADEPLLEVVPITSPTGGAVVLVNYGPEPLVQARVVVPADVHALFAGLDLPRGPEGDVLVDVDRVEILTLPPAEGVASLPAPPPAPEAAPPTASAELPCGCAVEGSGARGTVLAGLLAGVFARVRRSRRVSAATR